jgi:hypothetical protein
MRLKLIYIIIVLIIFISSASSQVILLPLDYKKIELGYIYKIHNRLTQSKYYKQYSQNWGENSFFANYKLLKQFTIIGEGGICEGTPPNIPNTKYRGLGLGIGFNVNLIAITSANIEINFYAGYFESIYLNKSGTGYHKNIRSIDFALPIEYPSILFKQKLYLWIAPAYISDKIYYTSLINSDKYSETSLNNFGIYFGINMIFMQRFRLFSNMFYADKFQYSYGVSIII